MEASSSLVATLLMPRILTKRVLSARICESWKENGLAHSAGIGPKMQAGAVCSKPHTTEREERPFA